MEKCLYLFHLSPLVSPRFLFVFTVHFFPFFRFGSLCEGESLFQPLPWAFEWNIAYLYCQGGVLSLIGAEKIHSAETIFYSPPVPHPDQLRSCFVQRQLCCMMLLQVAKLIQNMLIQARKIVHLNLLNAFGHPVEWLQWCCMFIIHLYKFMFSRILQVPAKLQPNSTLLFATEKRTNVKYFWNKSFVAINFVQHHSLLLSIFNRVAKRAQHVQFNDVEQWMLNGNVGTVCPRTEGLHYSLGASSL